MKNVIFLLSIMFILVGCSTVETKKYEDLESSVKKLNSSVEETFQSVQKKSREHGIQRFATSPLSRPSDLMISTNGYAWEMDKMPLYLTLKKTNLQLIRMNDIFEDYVGLLVQMASASLTKVDVTNSAKDLNKRSTELSQTLGLNAPKAPFAMLSSATVGLLQSYIDNKKEKFLAEAVKENQNSVEVFSDLQIKLIHFLRSNLQKTYNEEFMDSGKQWAKSNNKNQISSKLFDLNDSLIASLVVYEDLEAAYRALPEAHKNLRKTRGNKSFRDKINNLVKTSNKILEIQKDASKEGEKK